MTVDETEGPAPADLERAGDERYSCEYWAMVAWFRTSLETLGPAALTQRIGELTRGRYALSHEQPLLAFIEWYGLPALLRALAAAVEQPEHRLGHLEGD
jgi:hypothetical protein